MDRRDCSKCEGKGNWPALTRMTCPDCQGTGKERPDEVTLAWQDGYDAGIKDTHEYYATERLQPVDTSRAILQRVMDPFIKDDGTLEEACSFDHHGYCQSHYLFEAPCPFRTAADYLRNSK